MTFVNRILKSLFPKNSSEEQSENLLTERISRPSYFLEAFEEWQQSIKPNYHCKRLLRNYHEKIRLTDSNVNFYLYQNRASNGFYFGTESFFEEDEYGFMFELFKNRCLKAGYRLNHSKREIAERNEIVQTKEFYYLKPPLPQNTVEKINQLWGNISIEMLQNNGKTTYIKLMAHAYNDSLYSQEKKFEELIEILFKN